MVPSSFAAPLAWEAALTIHDYASPVSQRQERLGQLTHLLATSYRSYLFYVFFSPP